MKTVTTVVKIFDKMSLWVVNNLAVPVLRFYHNLNNLIKLFFGLEMTLSHGMLQTSLQRS